MGLEAGTYISDLNASNPPGTDQKKQGDDHIRLIKATLLNTVPNLTGAMTATHTQLNKLASMAAYSVLANATSGSAAPTEVAAGSDHQVLRRSGTSIGFGALDLSQAAAITNELPIANGGTGAATASGARSGLGLGSLAVLNTVNNGEWSGTDLAVLNGGTGASTASSARANLSAMIDPTVSTSAPSGGSNGDFWFVREA